MQFFSEKFLCGIEGIRQDIFFSKLLQLHDNLGGIYYRTLAGAIYYLSDAGWGNPSPTQTGQRSGELIAKGGLFSSKLMDVILCTLRRAFACSLPTERAVP